MKYNPGYYDPLLGKKFGRLVLLSLEPRKDTGHKKVIMARFRCECGHEETRRLSGVIHSKEPMCMDCRYRLQRYHKNDPLYGTWVGMMDRCYKCKSPSYKWYGAKGIRVCEEWKSVAVFSEWAKSHGWYKGCNIDRVNRDGPYSPSNCRIVSPTINQQNRSDNVMLTYNGETRCESEWERVLGFPRGRIQGRRRMGMKGDDLFRVGRYQNNGSRKCVTDINKFPEHLQIRQVPWAKEGDGK